LELVSLIVAAGLVLLSGPVLGLIALIRIAHLGRRSQAPRTSSVEARLDALETEIRELRQRLAALGALRDRPEAQAPSRGQTVSSPSAAGGAFAETPVAFSPTSSRDTSAQRNRVFSEGGLDLETLIAGRWLNRVGIVALLLAAGFFLKYAFDNAWIGPRGQVAIGLLSGTALLVYSQWLLRRGYGYFSSGIAGLAAGVLYLSLYAAWSLYQLVPQPVAFFGMIVVTGTMVALALGRDSQPLALLALIGGLLTPILLSTGRDAQIPLFVYLAVLNAGLLVIARSRAWHSLELVAFAGTVIYYWAWIEDFYSAAKLGRTAFFATLFFVEFTAFPIVQARQLGRIPKPHVFLLLANAASFLIALQYLLYRDHRWAMTVAVLALAAFYLTAMKWLPPAQPGERSVARSLLAGLALTFVTLAIPIRLEGQWIAIAWAVEGAALVWSGFQASVRLLRWAGILLLGGAAAHLVLLETAVRAFLWNPRFMSYALVVACLATSFVLSRRHQDAMSAGERQAFGVVGIAANFLLLYSLSLEVWELFARMHLNLGADTRLTQQLALSLLWAVYATALMSWGFRSRSPALRWSSLALFAAVVVKVFLYDLSFLERAYRIVSFTVLGILLVVVSFFYQQRVAAERRREPPS
jgi:uncharacterized membrane protein